jgi:hypothetical protein
MGQILLPKQYHSDFAQPGKKPLGPVEIDWSNPLTIGLISCVPIVDAGFPYDLARKEFLGTSTNSAFIGIDGGRRTANIEGGARGFRDTTYSPRPTEESIFWMGSFSGAQSGGDGTLGGVTYSSNTSEPPFVSCAFKRSSTFNITFLYNLGGGQIGIGLTPFSTGADQDVRLLGTITSGTQKLYSKGSEIASGSTSGSIGYGSDPFIHIGADHLAGGRDANSLVALQYLWNRALSPVEAKSISEDPYQILKPATAQIYTFPSAVAGITVTPDAAALIYTGQIPTVIAAAAITVEPASATLTYTGNEPTVVVGDQITVEPATASIDYTGLAPIVLIDAGVTVQPATVAITYTGLLPDVVIGEAIIITPDVADVAYTGLVPTVSFGVIVPTPSIRTRVIAAENRTLIIEAESRTRLIAAENRTMRF